MNRSGSLSSMKSNWKFLIALVLVLSSGLLPAQEPQLRPSHSLPDLISEPHHKLVFQNDVVRVFRLELQPNEATESHRHGNFYAFFSLNPLTIANEVRGRKPVVSTLEAGEVRTSKGGFTLAERNLSSHPAELFVVELVKPNTGSFTTPMLGFRYHDTATGELFEEGGVRAYTMTMAADGRTEPHVESYDRLVVALTDLKLRDNVVGESPTELTMKTGEVRWFHHGQTHSTMNVGTGPISFITFEFSLGAD